MMKLPRAVVPASVLVVLVACLAVPGAAQPAVQSAPAVAAPTGQAEKPGQSEADKKYAEMMKSLANEKDPEKRVTALEQFVRENPSFPRLETAYSSLLRYVGNSKANPEKALAIADEALARFSKPDSPARTAAVRAKLVALRALKRDEALKEFTGQLLESESNPSVLQAAAQGDQASALKLLEKAIAERSKTADSNVAPTLDALRWDYGGALSRAGRKEDSVKLMQEVIEETVKAIADLEALPKDDPKRRSASRLKMNLGSRYLSFATTLSTAGNHDKALEYLALAEKSADNPLENRGRFETMRAGIYEKMGKPELAFDSHVRAFAALMDLANRDKLLAAASKNGVSPADAYERARKVRRLTAVSIPGFELKTLEGPNATLDSFRSKVTLVNFFFPT